MPTDRQTETAATDAYGHGGGPDDCPICGAITPDYCQKARCEWESMRELRAAAKALIDNPGGYEWIAVNRGAYEKLRALVKREKPDAE